MGSVRMNVKAELVPSYTKAAKCLLERIGLSVGEFASPQEFREKFISALERKLKNVAVKDRGEFTVIMDGKAPRVFFGNDWEVTVRHTDGQKTVLFVGRDGAGVVQYGPTQKPGTVQFPRVYLLYLCQGEKVECEGLAAESFLNEPKTGAVLSAQAALEEVELDASKRRSVGYIIAGQQPKK
jgi:hypothetical protein